MKSIFAVARLRSALGFYFLCKRLFIYNVGHFRDVAAVVGFEDVDQSLHASSRHAFVRIGEEAGDATGTGEVRDEEKAICEGGIAKRRIGRQRLLFVNIEGGAGDPVLAKRFYQRRFVNHWTTRVIHQKGSRLHEL